MREFIKELSFRRLFDSLKLAPKHRLVGFADIWGEIFLWCFMTSIVVYLVASVLAIRALRSHKIGRWYAILIILAGIITPIIPSAITSALLSAVFYAASVEIKAFYCLILGVGQTGVVLFLAFLNILATL